MELLLLLLLGLLVEGWLDVLLRLPEELLLLLLRLELLLPGLEGRPGRLLRLLEESSVGGIRRVDEVTKVVTSSASWHRAEELSGAELFWLPLLGLLRLLLLLEPLLLWLLLDSLLLGLEGRPGGLLGSLELSSVGVELKIAVCGVYRVDEGVLLWLLPLLLLLLLGLDVLELLEVLCRSPGVELLGLSPRLFPGGLGTSPSCWAASPGHRPSPGGLGGDLHLLGLRAEGALGSNLRVVGGGLEAGGAGGHVVALQDPEAVDAGGVPHGDGLAVVVDVAVLADPLAVSAGLLPGDGAVLLGVRRAETAVSSVEPLLLQDLGIFAPELSRGRQDQAGGHYLREGGSGEGNWSQMDGHLDG